jgi:hypothetical protein
MARVSELAENALVNLHVAKDEIIATGDPDSILWALDQIRQAEAWLRMVMMEFDAPSDEAGASPEAE